MRAPLAACIALLALAPAARGDSSCRIVEIRFAPGAPDMQIAAWIEDARGAYVDTPYVTRLTGQFGLANRPGAALLKTDFRWPYGRREMVLPIWAHHRNVHYPKVMMGGQCGNSPLSVCPDNSPCGGDCVDSTIAYHSRVSSYEPFYCSPSGASRMDAMSCASKGTFAKGAYAAPPAFSLYPPRADLNAFTGADSPDAQRFAAANDLTMVSAATPPVTGRPLDPVLTWFPATLQKPPPDGDYVAWVEVSQESDFNQAHNHPNAPDSVQAWEFEGHPFLGQPSVVYRVPFHLGPGGGRAVSQSYAGFSTWDGSDGELHPPDGTITDLPGSGAGRLLEVDDGQDTYRVKVVVVEVADCSICAGAPEPVRDLRVATHATSLTVDFHAAPTGVPANRFQVRYREGDVPITDDDFALTNPAATVAPAASPNDFVSAEVNGSGIHAGTAYTIAVRATSLCNKNSPVSSTFVATPQQKFTVLHGCFVATAAYGSPLAAAVESLQRFRDEHLYDNPLGRLFVASYYATSPSLASAIAADRRLRGAAREALAPLVDLTSTP